MALDALSALPFAKLRMQNKAWHFALIKLMNIIINIAFNVLFLILFPKYGWYNKPLTIGIIFMANLIASACTLLLLIPVMLNTTFVFDLLKWKQLIKYGVPLMLAGLAGMINETFDRIALRYLLPPGPQSEHYMGVYGGCYKLAMLMTIFIQAYRFAAEPFFFGRQKEKNNRTLYAQSLNYFIIVCCLIFIGITLFIDWIKWFLSPAYYEGLSIIPVLLLANLFLGMYINFSMWFKLNGQTHYGLLFSVFGALITIIGLYTLVPIIGYQGAAYTTLICYFLMATSCFIVGQLKYPIPYNVKKISLYLLFSLLIYYVNTKYFSHINSTNLLLKGIAILTFIVLIYILEKSKKVVA
jgi:O-antigen/teichoic acid export membrane protein